MIWVYNLMGLVLSPFLYTGFIIKYFNHSGKISVEIDSLQIYVKGEQM